MVSGRLENVQVQLSGTHHKPFVMKSFMESLSKILRKRTRFSTDTSMKPSQTLVTCRGPLSNYLNKNWQKKKKIVIWKFNTDWRKTTMFNQILSLWSIDSLHTVFISPCYYFTLLFSLMKHENTKTFSHHGTGLT